MCVCVCVCVAEFPSLGQAGHLLIGDEKGKGVPRTVSGAISLSSCGVTTMNAGVVTSEHIANNNVTPEKLAPADVVGKIVVVQEGLGNLKAATWAFPQNDIQVSVVTETLSNYEPEPPPEPPIPVQFVFEKHQYQVDLDEDGHSAVMEAFGVVEGEGCKVGVQIAPSNVVSESFDVGEATSNWKLTATVTRLPKKTTTTGQDNNTLVTLSLHDGQTSVYKAVRDVFVDYDDSKPVVLSLSWEAKTGTEQQPTTTITCYYSSLDTQRPATVST